MKTKIFCDIADYETIKLFNNKPIVDGFTTNPSLMRLAGAKNYSCLLYTSPSPRDLSVSRMPSSA